MLRLLILSISAYLTIARKCTKDDYIFEYTECKPDGSRWRVSVPKDEGACTGGEGPAPPIKGQPCDFTCGPGTYLQKEGDQECHKCPAGEFSLGGGVRYSQWDSIPDEFSRKVTRTMEFSFGGQINCNGTEWVPRGSYVEAVGKDCSAQLILNVELIKRDKLTVVYQNPNSESIFKILTTNDQCVSSAGFSLTSLLEEDEYDDGNFHVNYPSDTDGDEWKTEDVKLSSGKNQIIFEVSFYGMLYDEGIHDKTVKIKSIEVNGIAYSSSCTLCPPGTYSGVEGASVCEMCPEDTYASKKRSSKCLPCNKTTHYSLPGSANCTWRKPCTAQDYFVTHTPCDESGQTRMTYKWVDPRVCRYDIQGSVGLPPSGKPSFCPPCNPGMSSFNSSDGECAFCPKGYHSSGKGECAECPIGTEPLYNMELKYFSYLPSNVELNCFSGRYDSIGCSGSNGWVLHGDYVGTEPDNDVGSAAKLAITTLGFRGSEGVTGGEPNTVGQIRFTFETICSADCQFTLLEGSRMSSPVTISSWKGSQEQQSFVYDVTHSGEAEFVWYFQRSASHYGKYTDEEGPDSDSLPTGELRIYSINITNTKDGGASYCGNCLTGKSEKTDSSECLGCPAGNYFDPSLKQCFPCPANTYANVLNPVGKDKCLQCGPGTTSVPGSTYCFSDCTFTDSVGQQYDFSALSGVTVNISGAPIFTHSGSRYFHQYTIDLCGGKEKQALCNATVGLSTFANFRTASVRSFVCQLTTMPHLNGTKLYADPISLGDQLLAVLDEESIGNLTRKDFVQPDERNGTVITFFYRGSRATFACPSGRSAVISLHCNPDEKGNGTISLPKNCRDGTCDGCVYGFVWHTHLACPYCRKDDYEEFRICDKKDNRTRVYYRRKQSSLCYRGVKMPSSKTLDEDCAKPVIVKNVIVKRGSIMDYKIYIAIGLGIFSLLVIVLFVMWYKNRSLEYKYQKLIQSSNPGDELPAPETCGQESDEEVVFDQKRPGGNKLLKKIKSLTGKKNVNDEEYFDTIKLEPMTSSA